MGWENVTFVTNSTLPASGMTAIMSNFYAWTKGEAGAPLLKAGALGDASVTDAKISESGSQEMTVSLVNL